MIKRSDYLAVQKKAAEIYRSGGVEMEEIHSSYLIASVHSTTGSVYETALYFEGEYPQQEKVASWECSCAWSLYARDRSAPYKHLENRMCSHSLATLYFAQAFKSTVR